VGAAATLEARILWASSKFYTTTELVLAISMSELEIRIDRAAVERIPTSLLELTTALTLRFHGWPRQR
jgi:hypothetical protein